jgi:hypothetical protein
VYKLGYELDGWDPIIGKGKRFFLFSVAFKSTVKPTQPLIQWVSRAVSLGLKRQGREADHCLHLVLRYLYSPLCLRGMVLNYIIKDRDKCTFFAF